VGNRPKQYNPQLDMNFEENRIAGISHFGRGGKTGRGPYKILATILASRMAHVLLKVISES
ncbi:hypothetical protein PJP07_31435, partial [Mycobacterium kansasii]